MNSQLKDFILSDDYWLNEAVEHFINNVSEERKAALLESFNSGDSHKEAA